MGLGSYTVGSPIFAGAPYLNLNKDPNALFGQLSNMLGGTNANSQNAINTWQGLGSSLGGLFENYGLGQRAQINQAFDTQRNNTLGRMASRGWGGSNLSAVGDLGVERNRQLALGDLSDKLLGQRIGAEQGVAQGLAGAYTNAGNMNLGLLGQMLGLGSGSPAGSSGVGDGGGYSVGSGGGGGSSGGGGGGGGGGSPASGGYDLGGWYDRFAGKAAEGYDKELERFMGTDGQQWRTVQTPYGPRMTRG